MILDYMDLLSPEPLEIDGICTLRPILVRDVARKRINYVKYSSYIFYLTLDIEKYFLLIGQVDYYKTLTSDIINKLNIFNLLISDSDTREILKETLLFFITENITYDNKNNCFFTYSKNSNKFYGCINENNYQYLRDIILQLNHVNIDSFRKQEDEEEMDASAKRIMDKIKKYKKNNISKTNKNIELPNIISSFCCKHNSINMLNVWGMTIYQLYDQFYRLVNTNIIDVQQISCGIWGAEFDYSSWYKSLNN